VLGFLIASAVTTAGYLEPEHVTRAIVPLHNWFLTGAFVCIGLELAFGEVANVGWRLVVVYVAATLANTLLALGARVGAVRVMREKRSVASKGGGSWRCGGFTAPNEASDD
jgi:uncharacterized membrane protein YadS